MIHKIFQGLKILDLSTVLAGPSVATFFAELGATVIKVENPLTQGDVTRSWKLPGEDSSGKVTAYFSAVNYGKSYVWHNLASSESRTKIEALIRDSDIVIVNFKYGDDIKFGLTPEEVFMIRPSIIYARITGFEKQQERVAYDVVLQAETGYMEMNGTTESGPVKMPVAMMDVIAAHQLKEGILCALYQRQQDGHGQFVECSLERAGLSALVNQASNYLMTNQIPRRMGSLHPNIAPYGEVFYCRDDKAIVLAAGSDRQFISLVQILGKAEIANDPRFKTNQQRVLHRVELADMLMPLFKAKSRDTWMALLIAGQVPAGAIRAMDEVMDTPQAKEMILRESLDGIETKRISSVAFRMRSAESDQF